MKEKIEHFLKFSNFEELADYLKKINVEIKEISQNRYIYGDFFDYFSKTIENFKSVLIKIINESSVNELVIKHFRYLLEFDVETETVDELLNGLKEKMCERIKNYLEYTENFEIRNFKDFFCDEFNVETLPDEKFSDAVKNADNYIYQIMNEKYNDEMIENLTRTNILNPKKKDLINVESIIKSLFTEIKDFLFMMKVLEENINLKIIHLSSQRNSKFTTIVTEIYFTLFEKLKEFLFVSNFDMLPIIKNDYNIEEIEIRFNLFNINFDRTSDQTMKLFTYYEKNYDTASTLFNENFNKNTLQNLSNSLLEIFDLFEVYLNKDTIEALNDSKNVTIEKIFMAFLNEKIISNLKMFNEDNTINFFDTNLSIFNYSSFSFTKNFLRNLFKSYRNIVEFYINILKKTKDVNFNYEVVYSSIFFLLKCFYMQFYTFYKTECSYSEDVKRLNCLILEILKNYNFLIVEVEIIMKGLFRNKKNEYEIYLLDLETYAIKLKALFIEEFTKNSSHDLYSNFINSLKSAHQLSKGFSVQAMQSMSTNFNYSNYNFYEKYNENLIDIDHEYKNMQIFTDVRSVLIEMILSLADNIKELYQVESQQPGAQVTEVNSKISNIISNMIAEFYENLIEFISPKLHLMGKDNESSPKKNNFFNVKLLSQLYMELELFNKILENFIQKENISLKIKECLDIILEIISKLKNIDHEFSYDDVFTEQEKERKNLILRDYSFKYTQYFRCFKIKT